MHHWFDLDGKHYTSLKRLVQGRLSLPNDILILMNYTSIYIHIPFCKRRCYYCDFNTYSGMDYLIEDYVEALCHEIELVGGLSSQKDVIHTIYFGGGTPSLLKLNLIEKIINKLKKSFSFSESVEVSIEANPGTLDFEKAKAYQEMGINRVSIGAQSLNEEELQLLGRIHNVNDIFQAVDWFHKAGLDNLNLDLIFGLPGQTMDKWEKTITAAQYFEPTHFSLYCLTIEPGTKFNHWLTDGKISPGDDDFAADCYDLACELLGGRGYEHYEISNWAKCDQNNELLICRHNEQYWENLPYYGFGAGAHGFIQNMRIANIPNPKDYITKMNISLFNNYSISPTTIGTHFVNKIEEMNDTLMLGLRLLIEGVGENNFRERFGLEINDLYGEKINSLIKKGLLEWVELDQKRVRLTKNAYFLGNIVFREFV